VNPLRNDTATTGQWARGNPETTTSSGTKQQGTTPSGVNALGDRSAGRRVRRRQRHRRRRHHHPVAGASRCPSGTLTLSFSFYLAHGTNATSADFFRAFVVNCQRDGDAGVPGAGRGRQRRCRLRTQTVNISAFAGQTVRIRSRPRTRPRPASWRPAVDNVTITTP
jgi:hypothetical protein